MLASKSTTVRLGIKGGTRSLVAQTYRGFTYRPIPVSCSAASGESKVIVRIPESKEEAIAQAVTAAAAQLRPLVQAKSPSKGFVKRSGRRACLCVDLPIASDSATDNAELGSSISQGLTNRLSVPCTLVFADEQAAAVCSRGSRTKNASVMHLREACRKSQIPGGVLLIISPKIADVALCDQLVQEVWLGSAAILINSEFAVTPLSSPTPDLEAFLQSLATVYSFQPVAVKGLLGNMEGAILKRVDGGAPNETPFKMLKREKDDFIQIGQSLKRPDNDDLEATFINASAAKSPLTKAARAVRGLFQRK